MTHLSQLIPTDPNGASKFGIHFIADYWRCPTLWAYRYLLHHPSGEGQGIVPTTTPPPLTLGGAVHEGLAAWYRSRCRSGEDTGEPNLDAALDTTSAYFARRLPEYEEPLQAETDRDLALTMLRRYHQWWHEGTDGGTHEHPRLSVLFDAKGEPLVEREVQVPLAWGGLVYTVRIDLLASWMGTPTIVEHKTTSASGVWALQSAIDLDYQFTGELFGARHLDPDRFGGMSAVLANILNKNPGKGPSAKTVAHYRTLTTRTDADLRKFHADMLQSLHEIEGRLERYLALLDEGVSEIEAIRRLFPKVGMMTGACQRYGRRCEYADLCIATGREEQTIYGFRPRVREPQGETSSE